MTLTLNTVQHLTGVVSAVCAALALAFVALSHRTWQWSGRLLGVYAAIVLCYGVFGSHVAARCGHASLLPLEFYLFSWLQKACTLLVLYMQFLLAMKWRRPGWLSHWWSWFFPVLATTVLCFGMRPVALDQLCHLEPWPVHTAVSSLANFAAVAGLVAWDLVRNRHATLLEGSSNVGQHPVGVAKTLCVVQGLRLLTQAVNGAAILFQEDARQGSVQGGFVQMLILEHILEAGQGIFCFLSILLRELTSERLGAARDSITSTCARIGFSDQRLPSSETQQEHANRPVTEGMSVDVLSLPALQQEESTQSRARVPAP